MTVGWFNRSVETKHAMDDILLGYNVNGATWFYLSLLLTLAVYFRFNRVWSLRNLDLLLLLSLSPGLLIAKATGPSSAWGYVWLFAVTFLLWVRLLFDASLTRRPRYEQNLNPAGLTFLLCSALAFQVTNIVNGEPHQSTVNTVRLAGELLKGEDSEATQAEVPSAGPAGRLLATPVVPFARRADVAARWLAILSHVAAMIGLVCLGRWHFSDTNLGLAMATLYLLLPCTAYDASRAAHVLPAALILWAVATHHRPAVAGTLLGLACGTMFFAAFLIPIWLAYYWKHGVRRFSGAFASVTAVLVLSLVFTSADTASFLRQIIGSIDWSALKFAGGEGVGFWSLYDAAYRIPVFATFGVMLVMLTIWPLEKNPEHLLAHSASTIVATQFWYPHEGGIYVLWYLPVVLAVVFRPRLACLARPETPAILATAQSHWTADKNPARGDLRPPTRWR